MKKVILRYVTALGRCRSAFYPVVALILLCASANAADMRVWTLKSGERVEGQYERVSFDSVRLRTPAGDPLSIKFDDLSGADMDYLGSQVVPEINIDVKKKQKPKIRNQKFVFPWGRDEIDVVTLFVDVRKKSRLPFTGVLNAEVFFIGKEEATDAYRLASKEAFKIRFTEENKGRFEYTCSTDFRVYDEYNEMQTRGANYEGYVVVVTGPSGETVGVETSLNWLEDPKKLEELRAMRIFTFFDQNLRRLSVPRPDYYYTRYDST